MTIGTTESRTARALTEQAPEEQPLTERDMTSQEAISKRRDERNEARQDLRDTLGEVNAKLEHAGDDFLPDHLIESHPVGASLLTGALGFFIGSSVKSRITGPVIIAALLGFALSRRSWNEGSGRDGRETVSDD
jgi:hypothetical protein